MNAIEFIQQHGVDKVRECIEEANAYGGFWVNAKTLELSNQIPSYDAVSIPDIQRLVESVDLVNWHGGIKYAKPYLERSKKDHHDVLGGWQVLEQAIADYESIYGESDE